MSRLSRAGNVPPLVVVLALAVAAVVAAVSVLVAASAAEDDASEMPGNASPEAGFARDMMMHHAQAVEMALIVREKSDDPELRALAYDIATSQQQQIGQMYAWLEFWGLPQTSDRPPMAWMKGGEDMLLPDGRMPGMASEADLARLRKAEGVAAEKLFLRLMIAHHTAGVHMAQGVLDVTDRPEVTTLARAIARSQQAEIRVMRDLLAARGGAPSDPGSPTSPSPSEGSGDMSGHDMSSMG